MLGGDLLPHLHVAVEGGSLPGSSAGVLLSSTLHHDVGVGLVRCVVVGFEDLVLVVDLLQPLRALLCVEESDDIDVDVRVAAA